MILRSCLLVGLETLYREELEMGEWGAICHVYSKCSVGYILTLRLRIL